MWSKISCFQVHLTTFAKQISVLFNEFLISFLLNKSCSPPRPAWFSFANIFTRSRSFASCQFYIQWYNIQVLSFVSLAAEVPNAPQFLRPNMHDTHYHPSHTEWWKLMLADASVHVVQLLLRAIRASMWYFVAWNIPR